MKPLCYIPAKRRSVRLAEKNIMPLAEKPMFLWSVEAALKSDIFDTVYVSTEDEEIKEMAEKAGATVAYLRPKELSGDTVTNVTVSLHLFDYLKNQGKSYDTIYCLQPSSPTRSYKSIQDAWSLFQSEDADFLCGVTPIDPHYFQWALEKDGNMLKPYFEGSGKTLRQSMEYAYRPNGSIKIANAEKLRQHNNFLGDRLVGFVMPEEESVHVATKFDAIVADAILRKREGYETKK